jgi:chromosome segregation protein
MIAEQLVLSRQFAIQQVELAGLQTEVDHAQEQLTQSQATLRDQEQTLETLEAREHELTTQTLALEASHAEAAVELERRRLERDGLWERAAEDNVDVDALSAMVDEQDVERHPDNNGSIWTQRIEQLRSRLRRMGPVNALAPEEYAAAQTRYTFLNEQLTDVRAAVATLRDAINQLDHVMQMNFETTFEAVAREFSNAFTQLFGGGSAHLVLLDPSENGTGTKGIDIIAQPPGKRQLNLQLLSGGERALTAAALLFAILTVNPSPFCILDEVDAALDEANVIRFRDALLRLAEQTQFILITHNRGTVEAANMLYGITMAPDGASRMLSLRLQEVDETLQVNV